ncbi:hypothetical protein M408DRAFT_20048 [Serendipita vermifera MAFF 305830]|uniref:Uncharacterized protein n=1 Tax=Serendipita vermifera MAFF 305830 TaxID=933852 RepID=A0A0C3BMN0_SERVB|nr:hypothetical protein M408DRAFT_20048 [Serendipita vermifera MAFF 305830]
MSSRFQRIKTDPRFRKPKKHANKVEIDPRFRSVLEDGSEKRAVRVDKYGRKISASHEKDRLRKFYRLADEDGDDKSQRVDYARGEGIMESSDEEEEENDVEESEEEGDIVIGEDPSKPIDVLEEEAEIDLDESQFAELDAQAEANLEEMNKDTEKSTGKATKRLAAVNLDWDHVKAGHLFKIFSSQLSIPTTGGSSKQKSSTGSVRGRLLHVRVYPSEFGKKRMAEEDKHGPPAELFLAKGEQKVQDSELATGKSIGGEEYDQDALRRYQLERLRYYYAIATFDSPQTAAMVYEELEGTELERSANVFDLSYVPEDMEFDDDFRDEAQFESSSYQPLNFATDALRHSNVKLTWDDDDPERTRITKRALNNKEIDEIDFKDLIVSASSEDEEEDSKMDAQKLRALLLSGNDENLPEGWGGTVRDKAGEMEITFTPGLSEKTKENKATEDETTLERYQRKERERKKAKKAARQERLAGTGTEKTSSKKTKKIDDAFFAEDTGSDEDSALDMSDADQDGSKPLKAKKTKRKEKHVTATEAATDAELALIMDPSSGDGRKHFDMADIIRSERRAEKGMKKRHGKRKRTEGGEEAADAVEVNLEDPRFKSIYSDPKFAIDPTNPNFKKTKSMKKLLNARGDKHASETGLSERQGKKRKRRE